MPSIVIGTRLSLAASSALTVGWLLPIISLPASGKSATTSTSVVATHSPRLLGGPSRQFDAEHAGPRAPACLRKKWKEHASPKSRMLTVRKGGRVVANAAETPAANIPRVTCTNGSQQHADAATAARTDVFAVQARFIRKKSTPCTQVQGQGEICHFFGRAKRALWGRFYGCDADAAANLSMIWQRPCHSVSRHLARVAFSTRWTWRKSAIRFSRSERRSSMRT
jgi:hypothetical protein